MSEKGINLAEKGIKNTKQRRSVLEVLQENQHPLDAMEIQSKVNEKGINVWISTIYRILELFTQKGIVIKNTIFGEDRATYELNKKEHIHYALCLICKKILEMDFCPIEKFAKETKTENFYLVGHKLEMYGYCDECYKIRKQA